MKVSNITSDNVVKEEDSIRLYLELSSLLKILLFIVFFIGGKFSINVFLVFLIFSTPIFYIASRIMRSELIEILVDKNGISKVKNRKGVYELHWAIATWEELVLEYKKFGAFKYILKIYNLKESSELSLILGKDDLEKLSELVSSHAPDDYSLFKGLIENNKLVLRIKDYSWLIFNYI